MTAKAATKKEAPKAAKSDATFAVIETGGKQYQVAAGEVITIEKLSNNHTEGDTVVFDKVLLVDNGKDTQIGEPYLDGAQVEGVYKKATRGKKIEILRFKAKSNRMRRQGHRQQYAQIEITKVS